MTHKARIAGSRGPAVLLDYIKEDSAMLQRFHPLALCSALLVGGTPALAAPNLYWDHLDGGAMSEADCVSKAESLMTKEKAGKITKSEDAVRSWSEHTVGVVECIKTDGKLMVMVLAGSSDASAGDTLFKALQKGMKP
jgi:hypothetical protein